MDLDPPHPTNTRQSAGHLLCLVAILALAFVLRAAALVWGQAYNEISQVDSLEAYEVAVAYELGDARAKYIGQPNIRPGSKVPGPGWTLFCVLGLRTWGSIEGVSWLLLAINVGAIGLLYLLARDTLGANAALFASLLLAMSEQAVRYSVPVFNPNVMLFFATLLILALWRVVRRERSRAVFWVALLWFLMLQFHLSGLALLPTAALLIWLSGRRLNFKWLLLGCAAGLITLGPYLLGEFEHDWENSRALFSPAAQAQPAHPLRAVTAPIGFLIYFGRPSWIYTTEELRQFYRSSFGAVGWANAWYVLSAIVVLLLISRAALTGLKAISGIWKSPRETFARHPGELFNWTLVLAPTLIGLVTGESFRSRYSLILVAPLFALAGAAAVELLAIPRLKRAFAVALATTVVLNFYFLLSTFRHQERQIMQSSRFVASFPNMERIYQSLRVAAGEGREVQVNDTTFAPPPGADSGIWFMDPKLIRRYVIVRENERKKSSVPGDSGVAVFDLLGEWQLANDERDVAYAKSGIVLVPAPVH